MRDSSASDEASTMFGYIYILILREFIRSGDPIVKVGRTSDVGRRMSEYPKGSRLLLCIYCEDIVSTETEILRILDKTFIRRSDIGRESFEGDINMIMTKVESYILTKRIGGSPIIPSTLGPQTVRVEDDAVNITHSVDVANETSVDVANETFVDVANETSVDVANETSSVDVANETSSVDVANETSVDVANETSVDVANETLTLEKEKVTISQDSAIVEFVKAHASELNNAKIISEILYNKYVSFSELSNWSTVMTHIKFCKLIKELYHAYPIIERDGACSFRCIQMPSLTSTSNMNEWNHDVGSSRGHPINEWCSNTLEVTGNKKDFIALPDLRDDAGRICQLVREFYAGNKGVKYSDRRTVRIDGERVSRRHVFTGLKTTDAPPPNEV